MCPNNLKSYAMFDNNIQNIIFFLLNFTPRTIINKYFYECFVIFQMLSIFCNEW